MAKKEKAPKEPNPEGGAEGEAEGKGGKKKLLMIVLPVLLAAGGGGYFMFGTGDEAMATETTVVPVIEGDVIMVDTMTVNLPDEHYAKVGFGLVLDSMADPATVEMKLPIIKDAALSILTGFDAEELSTKEGMERLRRELTAYATMEFEDSVVRVVLTELLVQ